MHVRFDERGVETEPWRGYTGTARSSGRQQTNQTDSTATAPHPDIVGLSFFQHRIPRQWEMAASEKGTCARGLRIATSQHPMFIESGSNPRVRLSSSTNTEGLPPNRLSYIAFAELEHARPTLHFSSEEVSYEPATEAE